MPRRKVSPVVRAFLLTHVRTLDELQLLMTVAQSSERWWDAAAIANELGMEGRDAGATLERFASRNLLDIRITDDVHYRFRPGTAELSEAAAATIEAYRASPVDVARVITERPRRITDFADAFRLRGKDDG